MVNVKHRSDLLDYGIPAGLYSVERTDGLDVVRMDFRMVDEILAPDAVEVHTFCLNLELSVIVVLQLKGLP